MNYFERMKEQFQGEKRCPGCAVYGVAAYLIEGQHITPTPEIGDVISECPVPAVKEYARHWWAAVNPLRENNPQIFEDQPSTN